MGAALVGAAVELAGFRVEFRRPDEAATAALLRAKPAHVLIDATDADVVVDDAVLGPAMMTGARLWLFGTDAAVQPLRGTLERYAARVITIPGDIERVREILTRRPSPTPVRSR